LKEGVIRQREFPPWIENRDYVADYASPTTTLIERINLLNTDANPANASPSEVHPSVYEIFQLDKSKSDSQINSTTKGQQQTTPTGQRAEAETTFPVTSGSTSPSSKKAPPTTSKPSHSSTSKDNDVVIQFFPEKKDGSESRRRNNKDDGGAADDDDDEANSIMISKL